MYFSFWNVKKFQAEKIEKIKHCACEKREEKHPND